MRQEGARESGAWPGVVALLKRVALVAVALAAVAYLALLVPPCAKKPPQPADQAPFAWDRDTYWTALQERFEAARERGCDQVTRELDVRLDRAGELLHVARRRRLAAEASLWTELEEEFFEAGALAAACPERLPDYSLMYNRLRRAVKEQSARWEPESVEARVRAYRLLYGGRSALEEVMIQAGPSGAKNLTPATAEPSATPAALVLGVEVHSGDLLVSRGGAPTSALIARGNDFPGNFSHVAIAFVDEETSLASIIEAHIECGVTVSSLRDYLSDKKLRVMIVRMRADLPQMMEDPLLPHRAAAAALARAEAGHVPYDFAMDFEDDEKLFCSEVALAAYRSVGVELWPGESTISSPGLAGWLAAFGVENFYTQCPSDLEYQPHVRVVAEWRDGATLWQDHLDNAVIDVLLEGAEQGDELGYDWYLLPFARVAKGYSMVLNSLGKVGPVPEGMSAVAALRNEWFSSRHAELRRQLEAAASEFERDRGYKPPYWELVRLARR